MDTVLQDYLNKNFSHNPSLNEISEHFISKFGVYVKNEGNYFHFDYDQIEAKWTEEVTHHCRGTIMLFAGSWIYSCRTFNKFFNHNEERCPFKYETTFSKLKNAYLRQKADGTLINLWYDVYKKDWRVSTTGCITSTNVNDFNFTFEDLFLSIALDKYKLDTKKLNIQKTYLFELCSKFNQIVTEYEDDSIFLLTVLDNASGTFEREEYEKLESSFEKVHSEDVSQFNSYEEIYEFVERTSINELYGKQSEGWVLYNEGQPVGKFKNQTYIALHHVVGASGPLLSKNLARLYLLGNYDDVEGQLPKSAKEIVENIKNNYLKYAEEVDSIKKQIINIQVQKEYALALNGLIGELPFKSYFFETKKSGISFFDWFTKKKQNAKDYLFFDYMEHLTK